MIQLGHECPIHDCDWSATALAANDRPDAHDYLILYQSVVKHLKKDHGATPGWPK